MATNARPPIRPRSSATTYLVLAVVAGLALAAVTSRTVAGARATVPVVVAAHAISPWEPITAADLRTAKISAADRTQGMLSSVAAAIGMVSDAPMPAGVPLERSWLNPSPPAGAPIASELTWIGQPGLRAYTLPVTQDGGIGSVAPGVRVDLLAAVKVPVGNNGSLAATLIIAQDVPVLAVQGGGSQGSGAGGGDVVLLVSPQEAQAIAFAQLDGTISLLLNSYSTDPAAAVTPAMTPPQFIGRYLTSQTTGTSSAPGTTTSNGGK